MYCIYGVHKAGAGEHGIDAASFPRSDIWHDGQGAGAGSDRSELQIFLKSNS